MKLATGKCREIFANCAAGRIVTGKGVIMRFDPTIPVIASANWYASHGGRLLEYIELVHNGEPSEQYIEIDPPAWLPLEQAARTMPTWEEEMRIILIDA